MACIFLVRDEGAGGNRETEHPGRASQQALNALKINDEHRGA
jgi:hypothetical protein